MKPTYDLEYLLKTWEKESRLKFLFFWGHTPKLGQSIGNFVLSQWYHRPFEVGGKLHPTAEHWMMAEKALLFGDQAIYEKILQSVKPGEAKALGRQVRNFDQEIWNKKRLTIVLQGNLHKFGQHADLKQFLLQTGNRVLVEASPVDPIWGIGMAQDHPEIENPYSWKGTNWLGFILMEVRDQLSLVENK